MATLLEQLNEETADAAQQAARALVQVHNGRGGGAGTIWHSDGLVITNAHVIGYGPVWVTLPDGRTLPTRVLARDSNRDLAALSVDARDLPTIELGRSRRLQPGQWVMALGHPFGVPGAATGGAVIGTGSRWPEFPRSRHEWVTVGLHLRPGHSGGPLIDTRGRLVGINTVMTSPDVGMAIPVHVVKAFLRETLGARRPAA